MEPRLVATKAKRGSRCGDCLNCKQTNCGTCKYCKDMTRFGGQNKLKQSCILRRCSVKSSSRPKKSRSVQQNGLTSSEHAPGQNQLNVPVFQNFIQSQLLPQLSKTRLPDLGLLLPRQTSETSQNQLHQTQITDAFKAKKKIPKQKRQTNRFNGMSEEEIAKKGLPDYLREGLDIVFIGINPSMYAAWSGKYYDGPGNHFWPALHLSGFLPHPMSPEDDHKLLDFGIGFTNVVPRTTRGLSDLSRNEIAEGAKVLREKLSRWRPKIAVFNGKIIFQVYSEKKKFLFGKQPDRLEGTDIIQWVMPSSSARCAQLPRAADKVPFFTALRKYRDFLNGNGPEPQEEEIVFANVVLKAWPKKAKKENNLEEIQENCNRRETEACEQTDVPDYYSPSTNLPQAVPNGLYAYTSQSQAKPTNQIKQELCIGSNLDT